MSLIEIRGLKKLYRMGDSIVQALAGVDLTIEKGEFVAITGASGSGKSTMMHLLGCLDRPTAGSYRLNGNDVSNMSDSQLALVRNREIGFVFQTFNLINRTSALDNVFVPLFYGRSFSNAKAKVALEKVGLGHRMDHKPSEMSGGERQRTAIARAIVNSPVLVLADEPTGNLDSRTGDQIMQVFHDLNAQGVTIILVTHEPDIARQARRIVSMKDGLIIADGTPDEVLGGDMHATVPSEPMGPRIATVRPSATAVAPRLAPVAVATATLPRSVPDALLVQSTAPTNGAPEVAQLTARMAPGAIWPLILSGTAWLLLIGAKLIPIFIPAVTKQFDPEVYKNPKLITPEMRQIMLLQLVIAAGFLVALILGMVSIFWSRAKLRYIQEEPGNWLGRKRIKAAFWMGLAVPAFVVGSFILRQLTKQ